MRLPFRRVRSINVCCTAQVRGHVLYLKPLKSNKDINTVAQVTVVTARCSKARWSDSQNLLDDHVCFCNISDKFFSAHNALISFLRSSENRMRVTMLLNFHELIVLSINLSQL